MTNERKLNSFMALAGLSNCAVAEAIGISDTSFRAKKSNKSDFRVTEINKLIDLLNIPDKEILSTFFCKEI